MKELNKMLKAFWTDEEGVTVVEYAVLAALIIVAVIATVTILGGRIDEVFQEISRQLPAGADEGA